MTEYGVAKMFQNKRQEVIYDAIAKYKTRDLDQLLEDQAVQKITRLAGKKNDTQNIKKRLREYIRILQKRLEQRGQKLPA